MPGLTSDPILPGSKVPDPEMKLINLRRDVFHGEWNYEILPRQ
jgi:hypothetical protein